MTAVATEGPRIGDLRGVRDQVVARRDAVVAQRIRVDAHKARDVGDVGDQVDLRGLMVSEALLLSLLGSESVVVVATVAVFCQHTW